MCGDVDNDGQHAVNDVTYLTNYCFKSGPPPPHPAAANVNGTPDGTIDVADLTYLVAFMFKGGADPICNHTLP